MCKRCNGTGWLEAIEGDDGSYVTSRPCPCGGDHPWAEEFREAGILKDEQE